MAYGLKYTADFSCQNKDFVELKIYEDAYTGLSKTVLLSDNPIRIRRGVQTNDKYVPIVGSSLTFEIISSYQLQYQEFFTSSDLKYRVDLFKNGSLYWTGYVQSDIYTEPYVKGSFPIQITATDGLANLKNVNYDASAMTTVNGGYCITIDEWLRKNLENLQLFNYGGIDFYIYEAVDLELDNAPASTSPLTYLHLNYQAKDGETIYSILEGLMNSFACRIFQKNGAYYILPIDLIYNESIVYRYRVDDAGGLDPTYTEVTQDNYKAIGRDLTWVNSDQVIEMVPAYNSVSITNRADVDLIIDSPMDADDWTDGTTLADWTTSGTFQTIRQANEFSQDGSEFYLKSEADQDAITQLKRVGFGEASSYKFEFEYFIKCPFEFEYDQLTDNWRIEFQIYILTDDGFGTQTAESVESSDNTLVPLVLFNDWLLRDAFTIDVVVTQERINEQKSINKWIKASYDFFPCPNYTFWAGNYANRLFTNLTLRFRGLQTDASSASVEEVYYRNFKVSLLDDTSYPVKTDTATVTTSATVTNKLAKTIMFDSRTADLADDVFAMQFYNDANTLAFKNDDADFIDAGKFLYNGTYSKYLSELVANRIATNYTNPSIKISGSIRGQIDVDSVVYDPNFGNKKFMVNFIEENLKESISQVEIIEIAEPI
jgi:hypothetical protein